MKFAAVRGVVLDGVEARLIDVQTQLGNGLPVMSIVGLPDTAVSESRERIRAAIGSSGFSWPDRRLTVALLPSDQRKRGPGLDLAIASSVLAVSGHVPEQPLANLALIGEVALDGSVRPVSGLFPRVLAALQAGCRVGVPMAGLAEAGLARNAMSAEEQESPEVFGVHDLGQLAAILRGDLRPGTRPGSC